ncbi:MAG: hypothetical protein DDT38_01059 [Firmicutes bacterium]|nr:hypothetical protein [candidate division NPL-UPA2 bacterium]
MKKVLLLVVVFALVAQVAVAAGPQAAGPRPGVGNMMRMYFGELRQGLNAMPNAPHMRGRMRLARERLDDLEALAQSDPAALAARMLERHDAMVAKAREIVANKATLPSQIVVDLKAAQARILERAREQAQKATDPAVAQRRLEALQAKQARVLAQVERNAE